MKIAIIGQAAFGETVLDRLNERGEQIVHVFGPPPAAGGRPDPMVAKAQALGLPFSQPKSFKGEEAFNHFKSLDADLAILAFVTIIVPERILYAPRFKSICFHPSLLPRRRGASAINWAIINGDAETGVTVFWPDKGIDTGPIIVQKSVPIAESDTTGSLYFNRLFPLGVEAVLEAVDLIKAGRAPAIAQDESLATYEPPCRDEHGKIDFSKSAREIYNLIRGCDPQPGAWAIVATGKSGDERRIRLYEAGIESDKPGAGHSGDVLAIDEQGMRIALGDAVLTIKRARLEPGAAKKVPPAELVAAGELSPSGLRLT